MNEQLTLSVRLNDEATLDNFLWGDNRLIEQQLTRFLQHEGESFIYLWGASASGKSHLLQACCQAHQGFSSSMYLPMEEVMHWDQTALEGLEEQSLLAIDNIDAIAGNNDWEQALFHLYNRVRAKPNALLIVSGKSAPVHLPLKLNDLRSRLSWGLVFQLTELNDLQKVQAIGRLAKQRGILLSDVVAHYLLNHCARNLHQLKAALDILDDTSLTEKRKITIPFVKRTLSI